MRVVGWWTGGGRVVEAGVERRSGSLMAGSRKLCAHISAGRFMKVLFFWSGESCCVAAAAAVAAPGFGVAMALEKEETLSLSLLVCCCCCCCWWCAAAAAAAAGGFLAKEEGKRTLYTPLDLEAAPSLALGSSTPPTHPPPFATLQPPQTHLPVPKTSLTLSFSSSIGPNSLRFSPSRLRSRLFPFSASVSHRCNFPVGDLCDIKVCVVYLTAAPPSAALIYRNICRTILPCRYSHRGEGEGEGAQPGVFYSSAYSLGNHPTSSTRNLWLMILFLIFETRNFLITRILEFMRVFLFVYIAQSV